MVGRVLEVVQEALGSQVTGGQIEEWEAEAKVKDHRSDGA